MTRSQINIVRLWPAQRWTYHAVNYVNELNRIATLEENNQQINAITRDGTPDAARLSIPFSLLELPSAGPTPDLPPTDRYDSDIDDDLLSSLLQADGVVTRELLACIYQQDPSTKQYKPVASLVRSSVPSGTPAGSFLSSVVAWLGFSATSRPSHSEGELKAYQGQGRSEL